MALTTAKGLLDTPVQTSMRLDAGLLELLKAAAKSSLRSVNAETNYRLAASFANKIDELPRDELHSSHKHTTTSGMLIGD